MQSTGLSARALSHVLAVDERTVRRWIEGSREMPGPARQLCRALALEPSLVVALGVD
jgi:DNA-binding transcriptional regulator YiaG